MEISCNVISKSCLFHINKSAISKGNRTHISKPSQPNLHHHKLSPQIPGSNLNLITITKLKSDPNLYARIQPNSTNPDHIRRFDLNYKHNRQQQSTQTHRAKPSQKTSQTQKKEEGVEGENRPKNRLNQLLNRTVTVKGRGSIFLTLISRA